MVLRLVSTLQEQKDIRQQRLEVLSKIEKVPAGYMFWCSKMPFTSSLGTQHHDCSAPQLFVVLLEVEETERMKTTVLSEAEETRLREKMQAKVQHIYSQLQHHEPLWVRKKVIVV